MSYRVTIELEVPISSTPYDVPRVASAVGMALRHGETARDLVITRLNVEHEND